MRALELAGRQFGKLTVLHRSERKSRQGVIWVCSCECGARSEVPAGLLTSGHSSSCGCGQKAAAAAVCQRRAKHGQRATRLYTIWRAMVQRCEYPRSISYPRYGARGIRVCPEWRSDFSAFAQWAAAAGYADNLSIDRIDNARGYAPDNCRWATAKQQANNRSRPVRA